METANEIVQRRGVPDIGEHLTEEEAYAWYDLAQRVLEGNEPRKALAVSIYLCYRIGGDESGESAGFIHKARNLAIDAWLATPEDERPEHMPSHVMYGVSERKAAGLASA